MLYSVVLTQCTLGDSPVHMLKIGFGSPATNDQILGELSSTLAALDMAGGKLLLVNGPASLPVAFAISHHVSHLYGAVGIFDPKMAGYVVAVSHEPAYPVGCVISASTVR